VVRQVLLLTNHSAIESGKQINRQNKDHYPAPRLHSHRFFDLRAMQTISCGCPIAFFNIVRCRLCQSTTSFWNDMLQKKTALLWMQPVYRLWDKARTQQTLGSHQNQSPRSPRPPSMWTKKKRLASEIPLRKSRHSSWHTDLLLAGVGTKFGHVVLRIRIFQSLPAILRRFAHSPPPLKNQPTKAENHTNLYDRSSRG